MVMQARPAERRDGEGRQIKREQETEAVRTVELTNQLPSDTSGMPSRWLTREILRSPLPPRKNNKRGRRKHPLTIFRQRVKKTA